MSELVVRYSSTGSVGCITFNRPPANAYDLGFHLQLIDAVDAADADSDARVVLVVSALDRFYCAGADIKAFASNSVEENKRMVDTARTALSKIEASGKAFIACISGHCLGGGLEIALACDLRFGAEGEYKIGLPEAKLGLLPGNGGSQRLPRIIGPSHAFVLLASGESIDPDEALRIGLLNRIFPETELISGATKLAKEIAKSAPLAVAACKTAVRKGLSMPMVDALELEANLVEELYTTEDAREGFRASTEKRVPIFKGC
ncbi:MAG: enoyl-CoA hydratase-related protein [Verrucomicrobiota bacterium]